MYQNIKNSKAVLSAEIVKDYFINLKETLKLDTPYSSAISPDRIYNYDETNLVDDPGVKKCIFRKGVKYPERIRDFSKSRISIMFC